MQTEDKITIGKALAHIKIHKQTGNNNYDSLSAQDITYINSLQQRSEELKSTIKKNEINVETGRIKDQTDFFLHLFLSEEGDIDCETTLTMLNNNSGLLDEFSVVLNDYIKQYTNLQKGKI